MFPKKNRLGRKDFNKIYKKGKRVYNKHFTLFYLKIPEQTEPQFGIVASTKVGKAAVRNKVKRRIREVVISELPRIYTDLQMIILTKPPITKLSYKELVKEFSTALYKLSNNTKGKS